MTLCGILQTRTLVSVLNEATSSTLTVSDSSLATYTYTFPAAATQLQASRPAEIDAAIQTLELGGTSRRYAVHGVAP